MNVNTNAAELVHGMVQLGWYSWGGTAGMVPLGWYCWDGIAGVIPLGWYMCNATMTSLIRHLVLRIIMNRASFSFSSFNLFKSESLINKICV